MKVNREGFLAAALLLASTNSGCTELTEKLGLKHRAGVTADPSLASNDPTTNQAGGIAAADQGTRPLRGAQNGPTKFGATGGVVPTNGAAPSKNGVAPAPAKENAGPAKENFGPSNENVGPARENAGPARENAGPARENAGPRARALGPGARKCRARTRERRTGAGERGTAARENVKPKPARP